MSDVVLVSGSAGSVAAAVMVAEWCRGSEPPTLVFADTTSEHHDTYHLVMEAAALARAVHAWDTPRQILAARAEWFSRLAGAGVSPLRIAGGDAAARLVWLCEGYAPLAMNSRECLRKAVPACCTALKVGPILRHLARNFNPASTTVHVGLTWEERCRVFGGLNTRGLKATLGEKGWNVSAPLCLPPTMTRSDVEELLRDWGIRPHAFSGMEQDHDNCGGACWLNSARQWHRLLAERPEAYLAAERLLEFVPVVAMPDGRRHTLETLRESSPGPGLNLESRRVFCLSRCLEND